MNRVLTLVMVSLCLDPLFSGERAPAPDMLKNLLLDLYAVPDSMIDTKYHARFQEVAALKGFSKQHWVNALMLLETAPQDHPDAPSGVRHFGGEPIARHIIRLYRQTNGADHPIFQVT